MDTVDHDGSYNCYSFGSILFFNNNTFHNFITSFQRKIDLTIFIEFSFSEVYSVMNYL